MGLDMYLTRKTYVKSWDNHDKWNILISKNDKPTHIDPKKVTYIEEEVGYWRKANQIHKWFVDNIQDGKDDCGLYYVSHDHLTTLRDLCLKVLEEPNLANKLLPTASGFFFGSTDYGEDYLGDLRDTVKICNEVLEETSPGEASLYYQSSW